MADKGNNARDLIAQKSFLIIPSFLNDGKLAAEDAMQSRTIASARIRVENTMKKLKEYKIFTMVKLLGHWMKISVPSVMATAFGNKL